MFLKCWWYWLGVNFINVKCTKILYERCFGSFYYTHVTREKLPKRCAYKKFVCLTLMKLTLALVVSEDAFRSTGKFPSLQLRTTPRFCHAVSYAVLYYSGGEDDHWGSISSSVSKEAFKLSFNSRSQRAFAACVCVLKYLPWLAQASVITLKTQQHAVNTRWKRLSQLSFYERSWSYLHTA